MKLEDAIDVGKLRECLDRGERVVTSFTVNGCTYAVPKDK